MSMVEKPENAKNSLLPGKMFKAYRAQKGGGAIPPKRLQALKVALVSMDCVLIGMQPILVHMSKNEDGKFSYNPVSVNFLTEVCKVAFALVMLLFVGTGRSGPPLYRSPISFIRDAHHNRLLAIPASLYAINNYLKFVMQLHFKPTTTKMLGNLKIFTIAMLLKVVMNRTFSVIQWEALFLLVFGITVNQLSDCPGAGPSTPVSFDAVAYTAGVVTIPAAASVYNEFALKKHMDTSVHLQNFFLYFYGMVFNLLGICCLAAGGQALGSIFRGFTPITMLLVANNAAQGILSSFFYKFADTILKKYSSTMATIFTGIMSALLFQHHLTMNFMIGVSIVLISMHQFFTFSAEGMHLKSRDKAEVSEARSGLKFTPSPSNDHLDILTEGTQLSIPGEDFRKPLLPP
ncbi:unnamed protein product [Ostreobium quekettii]|uniref:Nucleotide-sugar transporter n=1 Tax=Ostreobium quekettii TaxID=121088 RepID=A0A8S1IPB2_9CHLO|nr:unnamed protein product [Ostreobium quekettii]CAD7699678.1 unnamed protein product [Ostreobium quekettii]|eukprot:evm.model.scf_1545.3 EVM.evm.TU.scf_1545.3   scf_1545:24407-25615(-)